MKKTLKFKAITIILVSIIFVAVTSYFIIERYFMDSLFAQEDIYVEGEIQQTENLLDQYKESLRTTALDWSLWGETAKFIQDQNQGYISRNLDPASLANLNISMCVFFDMRQKIRYSIGNNEGKVKELPDSFRTYLENNASEFFKIDEGMQSVTGVIKGPEGPMLFAAAPIFDPELKGLQQGILVFARDIDENMISAIEKITEQRIEFLELDEFEDNKSNLSREIISSIEAGKKYVNVVDANNVEGYSVVKGFNREPLFMWKIGLDREIFQLARNQYIYLIF